MNDDLRNRKAPLDMDPAEFLRIGHQLVDQIAGFFETMPKGPVTPAESLATVRGLLDSGGLPESGADAGQLVAEATDLLFKHSLFNGHPKFFGYITSSPAPIGALADFLASAVNANVGAWKLAPMATEIEEQTIRWIAEFMGYPSDCGGLLASGGNMANMICLLAARKKMVASDLKRPCCYASKETHTWIQKAADMHGFEMRWVEPGVLDQQIHADREQGFQPFAVVGTAGSVSTGAVDPLPELAALCREHNLWFHVDGAYGGVAAMVPGAPEDLLGLSLADSVAVDPHKWLYAPLEAGCALVRDRRDLLNAFSHHPSYYNFAGEATNYFDLGPQNSRGFRALKVWLALRQVGRAGYVKMIADDIRLSRHLHSLLLARPEFEVFTQNLSIATFRYVPEGVQDEAILNRVNQELLDRVEKSGEAFLSNAMVDGKYALRACIVNFRTSLDDIEAMPDLLARLGRTITC